MWVHPLPTGGGGGAPAEPQPGAGGEGAPQDIAANLVHAAAACKTAQEVRAGSAPSVGCTHKYCI